MEFQEGTSVMTADGKTGGRLHRVVIDPETNQITHIVMQKGLLDKVEIVIDIQKVDAASPEEVTLACTADELQSMSPLDITVYVAEDIPPVGSASMGYPSPIPEHPKIVEVQRTIPEKLIALKEGAPVLSVDEEQVGNVERVISDPESCEVTHYIITKGLLLKEKKLVPADWVNELSENKVRLSVGAQQIKDVPVLQK